MGRILQGDDPGPIARETGLLEESGMNDTIINWTTATWNPTFGCSRVSEGCRHCYAERIALAKGLSQQPWTAANAAANVVLKPHKLREPFRLKAPSKIFV